MIARARYHLTWLAVTAALLLVAWPAQAGTVSVTGGLPRDLGTGVFNLTITVAGITQVDASAGANDGAGSTQAQFQSRLQFKLPDVDQTGTVPYDATTQTSNIFFYVSQSQAAVDAVQSDGTHTYTYYVTFRETKGGELKSRVTSNSGNTLRLSVYFYIGGKQSGLLENLSLQPQVYVVNEVPSFAGSAPIVGSMQSLTVSWNVPGTVQILGASSSSSAGGSNSTTTPQSPTRVNVFWLNPAAAAGVTTVPAKKFSGSASQSDTAATCTLASVDTKKASATCITCPTDGSYYLDTDSIASGATPGLSVYSSDPARGSYAISGLTNGKPYYVFLTYEPSGVVPSAGLSCLQGLPSPNFTLTELNGAGDAKVVDLRCFVATAAYGSPLHQDLRYFRLFRERVLLKNPLGRWLVHWYYRLSPPVAAVIAAHPELRTAARALLSPLAAALKANYEPQN